MGANDIVLDTAHRTRELGAAAAVACGVDGENEAVNVGRVALAYGTDIRAIA